MPKPSSNGRRKAALSDRQIRQQLRRVGTRRQRLDADKKKLHDDTIAVLKQAQGRIPTTEAAELVGLNRSTVYEVYRGTRKSRKERAKA